MNLLEPLKLHGVVDAGNPNLERIVIRAESTIALQYFYLGVGIAVGGQDLHPINDNSFWLGKGILSEGDWLFVYTGPGMPTTNAIPNSDGKLYSIHWGRKNVLFRSPEIQPMLIRTLSVSPASPPIPQIGSQQS